ncbi:MAG: XylR family transcriptional regulator [Planctomycetota bacterium]
MRKRRSVALLIETSNAYSRGLLDGVLRYTKERGHWSVQITEQERGASPPSWFHKWKGDGIIARIETDTIGRKLATCGFPVVDLSAARHVRGIPWADTDDRAIADLAFKHFRDRNFRHLAFCGDAGFAWSRKRAEHFAHLAASRDFSCDLLNATARYDDGYDPETERQRVAEWLGNLPKPVGILACYDFKAQQVLDACRFAGLRVPEQVAVLGVDNDQLLCEFSDPTLSSIVPDTQRTGYEAAELLDQMMDGEFIETERPLLTKPLGIAERQSTDTLAIDDPEVSRALHYIRKNATYNIRVEDVLQHVDLSRRAFEHRFQKLVGVTPHAEILRVRLARVASLLKETELTIHEIARRTGYEHGEYLAATFKREMGMTPTKFRTEHGLQRHGSSQTQIATGSTNRVRTERQET